MLCLLDFTYPETTQEMQNQSIFCVQPHHLVFIFLAEFLVYKSAHTFHTHTHFSSIWVIHVTAGSKESNYNVLNILYHVYLSQKSALKKTQAFALF